MKALLALAVLLILASVSAFAQSATLAVQEQPPARTSIVVGRICEQRADPNQPSDVASAQIELWKLANDGSKQDTLTIQLTGAEVGALVNAEMTPIAGEAGNNVRKKNARVLKFLHDNCANFATPCPSFIPQTTIVP